MTATVGGVRHPAVRAASARREVARTSSTAYVLLFAVLAVLVLIGLVMVVSSSSVVGLHDEGSSWHYFSRQLIGVVGGSILFLLTVRVDYRRWRKLALPLYLATVGLLVAVLVPGVGVNVNGSSRWVDLGFMQLQPSEFAKLGTLLIVADLLARRQAWVGDPKRALQPALLWLGLVAALLMIQPNLGTTLVLGIVIFAVLFTAGAPGASLARWGGAGAVAALIATLGTPYRRARFLSFLDPWADPAAAGYQNIQAQVSLGSGGWLGVGLGESRAKWGFLPEAHTDFIFAIIGEELGLVGALTIVALFAALGYLGVRAAAQAPDAFGRLLAIGITTWFCVQAFVNVGAVVGILPITGVPLPFISFGSSAMLANMAAAGMLCNVCRSSRR
ncbi:MAG: putative lipid II flippase FtsW [Acidimicrobiia bacterium]|nr:putative lipid II flippase FtsW [Acidimicrobiia bacterium]